MATITGSLSISSENIFPVIKKWLYSDHDIFYREIISNGCDAITKLKKLALMGEYEKPEDLEYKIQVTVNPTEKSIAITDNGLCIGTANPFYGGQVWLLEEDLRMGDVNMDGEVNIFDATEVQCHIAEMVDFTDDQMYVADVNHDGEVNIFDVTTIQLYIAEYITEF